MVLVRRLQRKGLTGDVSGASTVEMAFAMPIFAVLLFAILELGALGMVSANFNAALDIVARRIRTGQADRPTSVEDFRAAVCARMADGVDSCRSRLKVIVQPIDGGFAAAQTAVAGQTAADIIGKEGFSAGDPQQVMLVTATYAWPLVIPLTDQAFKKHGDQVLIVSRLAFRNEPWNE